MLSILIPTYNYDVTALVKNLQQQCLKINGLVFEVLVYDDGSSLFRKENRYINSLEYCSCTLLDKNIGRSAIRNMLARNASYENLLFLDADVQLIENEFISDYLKIINEKEHFEVVYGGIVYQEKRPESAQLLRWVYGNEREALNAEKRKKAPYVSFLTLNFLIKKRVFDKVRFNEEIPNLRYEDLLFSYHLMNQNIKIAHIDNQVVHNGLETSTVFLSKTNESLVGLKFLLDHKLIPLHYARITSAYHTLKKLRLTGFSRFLFLSGGTFLKKNLLGTRPSLFLYDIYRLGYFSTL